MSKRYGKLPSEVMATATTFDLYVSQMGINYEIYLQNKDNIKPEAEMPSQEKMLKMIERVKEKNKNVNKV